MRNRRKQNRDSIEETTANWHTCTPPLRTAHGARTGHSIRRQRSDGTNHHRTHTKAQARAAEATHWRLKLQTAEAVGSHPFRAAQGRAGAAPSTQEAPAWPSRRGDLCPSPRPRLVPSSSPALAHTRHQSPTAKGLAPLNPPHRLGWTHITPLCTEVTGYKLRSHAE